MTTPRYSKCKAGEATPKSKEIDTKRGNYQERDKKNQLILPSALSVQPWVVKREPSSVSQNIISLTEVTTALNSKFKMYNAVSL